MMEKIRDFAGGEVLLVDKPKGWTSFDVVNKIRYSLKPLKLKVGHAGTLDPLATGLLIICTGKKTKEIESYQALSKVYTGKFMLGKTTPSYDLETEVNEVFPTDHISSESLTVARESLTGEIQQIPPLFSAIKVDGRRAYEMARKGEDAKLKPRNIQIFEFKIDDSDFPEIEFYIHCSKGTYIRSIARDFGEALNSGAYLSELRREKIGEFDVSEAYSVNEWVEIIKKTK